MTRDELRTKLVNGIDKLFASRIASRFMTQEAHAILSALQTVFATDDHTIDATVAIVNANPYADLPPACDPTVSTPEEEAFWERVEREHGERG